MVGEVGGEVKSGHTPEGGDDVAEELRGLSGGVRVGN